MDLRRNFSDNPGQAYNLPRELTSSTFPMVLPGFYFLGSFFGSKTFTHVNVGSGEGDKTDHTAEGK
jgi:hypothetical protein